MAIARSERYRFQHFIRAPFTPASISPMLKLSSFDDGKSRHDAKPRLPDPTDVMLVPIPVLPKVSDSRT